MKLSKFTYGWISGTIAAFMVAALEDAPAEWWPPMLILAAFTCWSGRRASEEAKD